MKKKSYNNPDTVLKSTRWPKDFVKRVNSRKPKSKAFSKKVLDLALRGEACKAEESEVRDNS